MGEALAKKKKEELEWKQKQEEKRKQEEERRQKEEEARQARIAEQKKNAEEQKAVMAIKQVTGKLQRVQPEGLDDVKKEIEEILEKELENCGSKKDTVKQEVDKALETADTKCQQTL